MTSEIHVGDCRAVLRTLPAGSVHCVVTSPPYWGLRDYGVDGQLGSESTPEAFVATMVEVFREVRRVLRDDGTCWVNLGDTYASSSAGACYGWSNGKASHRDAETAASYNNQKHSLPPGLKPKDLCGIPWRVALALQADGWWLRQDIVWSKPNPMPESCRDRCTKAHEYLFLLTKAARYYYDADAIREGVSRGTLDRLGQPNLAGQAGSDRVPGKTNGNMRAVGNLSSRNRRSVWTIPAQPYAGTHFATYPEALVVPCVKAGTSDRGCCPACGAGWVRGDRPDRLLIQEGRQKGAGNDRGGAGTQCGGGAVRSSPIITTTGWRPGCACRWSDDAWRGSMAGQPLAPEPAVVLDPFCGAGTTGVAAKRLGRSFVGCELNPDYAAISRKRIANPDPLPAVKDVPGQMTLEGLTDEPT